jgi:hypothetical protein
MRHACILIFAAFALFQAGWSPSYVERPQLAATPRLDVGELRNLSDKLRRYCRKELKAKQKDELEAQTAPGSSDRQPLHDSALKS